MLLPGVLICSIGFLTGGDLYAQKGAGEIIVVRKRVGEKIDLQERNKFKLFKAYKNFQSAVVLKLSENEYVLNTK